MFCNTTLSILLMILNENHNKQKQIIFFCFCLNLSYWFKFTLVMYYPIIYILFPIEAQIYYIVWLIIQNIGGIGHYDDNIEDFVPIIQTKQFLIVISLIGHFIHFYRYVMKIPVPFYHNRLLLFRVLYELYINFGYSFFKRIELINYFQLINNFITPLLVLTIK